MANMKLEKKVKRKDKKVIKSKSRNNSKKSQIKKNSQKTLKIANKKSSKDDKNDSQSFGKNLEKRKLSENLIKTNENKKLKNLIDEEITKIAKSLWEVNFKTLSNKEKEEKVNHVLSVVKGHLKTISRKGGHSRVLEICLKHTNASEREAIFEELKPDLEELCCNKYGKFVVISLIKNSNRQLNEKIFEAIYEIAQKICGNRYGSLVFDLMYRTCRPSLRLALILPLIYPPALLPERKNAEASSFKQILEKEGDSAAFLMKSLAKAINTLIKKEMLTTAVSHRLILEYVSNCPFEKKQEVFSRISSKPLFLAQSKIGCRLAVAAYTFSSPKQRKAFLKAIQRDVKELSTDENGWIILARCLEITDDTVLLNKTIIEKLKTSLNPIENSNEEKLILNKNFHKIILNLLHPRGKHFLSPEEIETLFNLQSSSLCTEPKESKAVESNIQSYLGLTPKEVGEIAALNKKDPHKRKEKILEGVFELLALNLSASDTMEHLLTSFSGRELLFETVKELQSRKTDGVAKNFIRCFSKVIFTNERLYDMPQISHILKRIFALEIAVAQPVNSTESASPFFSLFYKVVFAELRKAFFPSDVKTSEGSTESVGEERFLNWVKTKAIFSLFEILKSKAPLKRKKKLLKRIKKHKKQMKLIGKKGVDLIFETMAEIEQK